MNKKILKKYILTFLTIMLIGAYVDVNASAIDSVGTKVIDGKVVILHKVEPKQTLYAIHRKYNVSVEEIIAMNPGVDVGLKVDQILHIPTSKTAEKKEVNIKKVSSENAKIHIVQSGETLYGVSKMYPATVEQIKKWNNLKSNSLSVGQRLQISEGTLQTKALEKVEEQNVMSNEKAKVKEDKPNSNLEIENVVVKKKPTVQKKNQTSSDKLPSKKEVDMGGHTKIFEKGYAELLPNTSKNQRYLAHHRTLPEGTIIQVENLANGKTVFVRVVGKLESDDPELIIKISYKTQVRLECESSRFLTEIRYLP